MWNLHEAASESCIELSASGLLLDAAATNDVHWRAAIYASRFAPLLLKLDIISMCTCAQCDEIDFSYTQFIYPNIENTLMWQPIKLAENDFILYLSIRDNFLGKKISILIREKVRGWMAIGRLLLVDSICPNTDLSYTKNIWCWRLSNKIIPVPKMTDMTTSNA